MFFVEGVTPIAFYDIMLLPFNAIFFIDPKGIFFVVMQISFELVGDSSGGSWIIFVDFDLFKSYLGFGSWSFKQFRFLGNLIVLSRS